MASLGCSPSPRCRSVASAYRSTVDETEAVAVVLPRADWAVIQEALDAYFYEVEHAPSGGLRRTTRERNAARRDHLLAALPRIDAAIATQAGVGPFSPTRAGAHPTKVPLRDGPRRRSLRRPDRGPSANDAE